MCVWVCEYTRWRKSCSYKIYKSVFLSAPVYKCVCVSYLDHEVVLLVHLAHTPHHLTLLCLHSNRPRGGVLPALCCQRRPVAAIVSWKGDEWISSHSTFENLNLNESFLWRECAFTRVCEFPPCVCVLWCSVESFRVIGGLSEFSSSLLPSPDEKKENSTISTHANTKLLF